MSEDWRRICDFDEVANNRTQLIESDGEYYYVTRKNTEVLVFDAVCPHHATNLSFANIVDGQVECPLHGWQFDVASGECIRGGRDLIERQTKIEKNTLYVLCS